MKFQALIALVLISLLLAIPVRAATEEVIVFEINSDSTLVSAPTENPTPFKLAAFIATTDGLFSGEQSVAWQADGSWNEFVVSTGATGTDNTTKTNRIYWNWNLTVGDLLSSKISKIVIELKGVNVNSTISFIIWSVSNSDYTNKINILNISSIWTTVRVTATNTTEVKAVFNLDPAILSYIKDNQNDSHIIIRAGSTYSDNEFFTEGQKIYFRIYAVKLVESEDDPAPAGTVENKTIADIVTENLLYVLAAVMIAVVAIVAVKRR